MGNQIGSMGRAEQNQEAGHRGPLGLSRNCSAGALWRTLLNCPIFSSAVSHQNTQGPVPETAALLCFTVKQGDVRELTTKEASDNGCKIAFV